MSHAVLEYHSRGYETHRYVFSRISNRNNLPTAYLGIDPPMVYNNNLIFKQNSHPSHNLNYFYDNSHIFSPNFHYQLNKKVKKTKGLIKLDKEITAFCQSLEPTDQTDKDRQLVIDRIRNAIQASLPNVTVEVFGSFKTGLYLPSSDIDIVVFHDQISPPFETIRNSLIEAGVCEPSKITILSNATVPIIKLTDTQTNIKIDIAFNVENASKSASFIQASLNEWPVMKNILTVLKQLLKDQHLNEVYSGGVSSYSLTLLILFFLKQALPKGAEGNKQQKSSKSTSSVQQNQSCAMLLLKLLEFYVHSFNYHVFGISVNPCGFFFKQFISDALVIEDPLCPSNDVARGSYRFSLVQCALKEAYDKLNNGICNYHESRQILESIIHINKTPSPTSPMSLPETEAKLDDCMHSESLDKKQSEKKANSDIASLNKPDVNERCKDKVDDVCLYHSSSQEDQPPSFNHTVEDGPSPPNHPCIINQPNDHNSPTNYPNNNNSGISPCIQQKPCNDIQQSSPPPSSHTSSSSSSSYVIVNPSDEEDEEEDDGVQSGSDSGFSDSKNCPFKRSPTENLFYNKDDVRKFSLDLKHLHQRHHPLHLHPLDQLKYIQQQQQQLYYTCRPIKNNRAHKNPHENNTHQQQQQQRIMHLNDLLCSLLLSDKVHKRNDTMAQSQRDDNADNSDNKPSNIDAALFDKNESLPCKIVNNNNNSSYPIKKNNNSNNHKNNKSSYYYYYSGSNQKVNNKNSDARRNKRNRKYNNNNNNIAFINNNCDVNNNNVKSSNLDDKSDAKNVQKAQNNNYNKKNNNRNKKTYNNHYYKNNCYRTPVS